MSTTTNAIECAPREGPLSERVIRAVAEARGVEPLDLDPIYDDVDLEALDALFSNRGDGGERDRRDQDREAAGALAEFTTNGCAVAIHDDGRVVVREVSERQ